MMPTQLCEYEALATSLILKSKRETGVSTNLAIINQL